MGMMLNRRRIMGGKALPYDAEIEYLESQGNCTIPTGVVPTGTNITIKTKIYYIGYTDSTEQWTYWFTTYVDEQHPTYRILRLRNTNNSIYINNSGRASEGTFSGVSPNTLYNIEMYPGYCLINDKRVNLSSLATPVNTDDMKICSPKFKGRFYFFYMADGDNILLDLIPVRIGTTGYMYDKVSGKLFGNAGTGQFILGPDVK